jgi:hypothetical protein
MQLYPTLTTASTNAQSVVLDHGRMHGQDHGKDGSRGDQAALEGFGHQCCAASYAKLCGKRQQTLVDRVRSNAKISGRFFACQACRHRKKALQLARSGATAEKAGEACEGDSGGGHDGKLRAGFDALTVLMAIYFVNTYGTIFFSGRKKTAIGGIFHYLVLPPRHITFPKIGRPAMTASDTTSS